jgi:hypothetical protein
MERTSCVWLALGLIIVLLSAGACSVEPVVPEEVEAAPAESTPEEMIEDFFHWYATYPGNPIASGALAANPIVRPELMEKVTGILDSFEGPGGYDPILCAQERPRSFSVEILNRSLDSASGVVRSDFEGHQIYVGVLNVDDQWMIADVTCPGESTPNPHAEMPIAPDTPTVVPTNAPTPPVAEESGQEERAHAPAGWSILRDEALGFQVAYPPDWGAMDLPLRDPGESGPPTVIKRIVMLYPLAWEERLKPGQPPDPNASAYPAVSIEVCEGTMEAYRREFMELASSEAIEVNGFAGLYERDTFDDHNMMRYIFQHPTRNELIISLTDAVNGFSARVEESGEVTTVIPQVVETFRFTD